MLSIVVIFTFLIISLFVVRLYSDPTCGGTLNPNLRYCNPTNSRIITGRTIPEKICNPSSNIVKAKMATEFVDYLTRMNKTSPTSLSDDMSRTFPKAVVLKGTMFFAIPPLLKLLPSDFGQNEVTPYGIVSFSDVYTKQCVTDKKGFCDGLSDQNPIVEMICEKYLDAVSLLYDACPFPIFDGNTSLHIQDTAFFNLMGALGTFSLTTSQCLVMYYDFPVGDLPLNYWSFNLYMADRLGKQTCAPYRQTYLASITPPMNCFMTPSIAGKRFNPITGKGDVVEAGHLKFYMIVTLNKSLGQRMASYLQQRKGISYDFIHVFEVPSGPGSILLDGDMPNPNGYSSSDTFFNAETDRLSLFMRLSPDPEIEERSALRQYIYSDKPFQNSCEVCFVDMANEASFQDNKMSTETVLYDQPQYISPRFNEKQELEDLHDNILTSFSSSMQLSDLVFTKLDARSSVLNIFAPLFKSILNTTKPYLGGWQAIQLAGCAQGDNPDTQYRISTPICLSQQDVMVSISVNHSKFGNCLYNNINVVDINKAFSVASITLNKYTDVDYYVVMVSRDAGMLQRVQGTLTNKYHDMDIAFFPVLLKTGATEEDGVPMCHQLLMVERVYVNMQYPSVLEEGSVHHLEDVFGNDMRQVNVDAVEDAWDSLKNVVAPSVDHLIPPSYYKVSSRSSMFLSRQSLQILFSSLFVVGVLGVIYTIVQTRTSTTKTPKKK